MNNNIHPSSSTQTLSNSLLPKELQRTITPYVIGFALIFNPLATPSHFRQSHITSASYRYVDNTSITVTQPPRIRIDSLYVIRNPDLVELVLNREGTLRLFLIELRSALQGYFPNARFALEYQEDPEEEILSGLRVNVITTMDPSQAVSVLAAFDENWWFRHINEINHPLFVNLEFYEL